MSREEHLNAAETPLPDDTAIIAAGDATAQEPDADDDFVEFDLSDVTLIESKVFG